MSAPEEYTTLASVREAIEAAEERVRLLGVERAKAVSLLSSLRRREAELDADLDHAIEEAETVRMEYARRSEQPSSAANSMNARGLI